MSLNEPVTVLLQGAAASGKSQLICWHTLGKANAETTPTLEEAHQVFEDVRGRKVEVCILDTAGRKKYGDMIEEWVDRANAQILVLNLEDAASVAYLKLHQPLLSKSTVRARVLVGNLPSGKSENRVVTQGEATSLAKTLFDQQIPYMETNTRTGEGVRAVFATLMERMYPDQRSGAGNVKGLEEEKSVHNKGSLPDGLSQAKFEQLLAERDLEIKNLKTQQLELETKLAAQEKAFLARFEALESKLTEASLTHHIETTLLAQLKKIGLTKGSETETPPKPRPTAHRGRGSPVKQGLFSTTSSCP